MREIKFRAWDKEKKAIWTPIRSINFAYGYLELSKLAEPESDKDFDEIELMQFTGLKDKNGREIYEGDIISFTDLSVPFKRASVYFENGCFYADDKHPQGNIALWYLVDNNRDVEVIGNIYENPELLKD